MTTKTHRIIKWISVAVIGVSILLLMRVLPTEQLTESLRKWIEGLGFGGPVVFAIVYVVATVCLVPGSLLTLLGGAIFGLAIGFITVSFASITGAACAFLISRYVARAKVASMAAANDKFEAIDDAISEGGWKIVGLLRLSPAIPFNVQNYLFGLTDIKFWHYVLTSWIAMVPGTFMYVYLGHAAGSAAVGDEKSPTQWVLLGIGLMTTVIVTVYITKLSKRKLRERADVRSNDGDAAIDQNHAATVPAEAGTAYLYAVAAATLFAISVYAQFNQHAIAKSLGL